MSCPVCNNRRIVRYYHDAGDHFGGGKAPESEWIWVGCRCTWDMELRCEHLSDKPGHPIFNKPSCESKDRPGRTCDYHPKHYGDCIYFKFMTP